MKKTIKTLLTIIFFFASLISYSQVFYYSGGKKIPLERNTKAIFISLDKSADLSFANSFQKVAGVRSVQFMKDMSVASLELSDPSNKSTLLATLKKNPKVFHAWEALSIGKAPVIPTGKIALKPNEGITLKDIIDKLKLTARVSVSDEKYYDILVLNVTKHTTDEVFGIANLIYESKMVTFCHPDFYFPIEFSTNDPLWNLQYYLRNTGQLGGIAGIDINVDGIWNVARGNTIRVAVIDDGVEDHEDLSGRVLNGYTANAAGNGAPTNGAHGQACAGLIGATQDNNLGITGVAPQCQIVPINIWSGNPSILQIAGTFVWAWDQGQADVISGSWGFAVPLLQYEIDVVEIAINSARTQGRGGKGTAVVFAAGNSGGNVALPGRSPGVITVGACTNPAPAGDIWYYSSQGPTMDVVAPSGDVNLMGDVRTLDRMGAAGYEIDNYTPRFGGTSAAGPLVAGIVALMLSANPNLTEAQVTNILQTTATDMGTAGFDNTFGFGRANACAAVRQALTLAVSINGKPVICNSEVYFINNLPTGATVTWSIPGSAGAVLQLAQNTPSTNQLTITNQKWYGISTTLTVTINLGCGNPIVLNMAIANDNSNAPYSYTWSQQACCFYNVCHPAESGTLTIGNTPPFVHQGCTVTVNIGNAPSVNFIPSSGTPISTPMSWAHIGTQLIFQLPLGSGGIPFIFRLGNNGSCGGTKDLLFFTISNNGRYFNYYVSPNPVRDVLTINAVADDHGDITNSAKTTKANLQFTADIIDFYTNSLLVTQKSSKGSIQQQINVSKLKKGLYILRIKDNEQVQTIKFIKE